VGATLLLTVAFGLQFPKIRIDTDPKNMLPETSQVRRYNDQVEGWFGLHPDVIVVGIRNEGGLFNPESLRRIEGITDEILKLPCVVARDVISLSTVDDVTVDGETLRAQPLLDRVPESEEGLDALKERLTGNPLVVKRLVSADGKVSAIYVPIEKGANGKEIADKIRKIAAAKKGPEQFFFAGDPVARDTFGIEMFRQMAYFSPLAGMVMMVALYFMFRSATLVIANMGVAMISIIWSMGFFIGLGVPIHIMASMGPVFLMAISTDTVHIFNEFYFRYKDVHDKREAILQTMETTATPIAYSDLTTAAGFASLAVGPIVPVKIFGLLVAFGTLVVLLMSFTLVPALMALMKEERIERVNLKKDPGGVISRWLSGVGRFATGRRTAVVLAGALLIAVSAVGIARIRVNNNMIHWFKAGSDVRKADRVLNDSLGGTASLYLVADAKEDGGIADPRVLRSLEGLQKAIEKQYPVGKTVSVADYVKRINRFSTTTILPYETIPDSRRRSAVPSSCSTWRQAEGSEQRHRLSVPEGQRGGSAPVPGRRDTKASEKIREIPGDPIPGLRSAGRDRLFQHGGTTRSCGECSPVYRVLRALSRAPGPGLPPLVGDRQLSPPVFHNRPYLRSGGVRWEGPRHAHLRPFNPLSGTGRRLRHPLREPLPAEVRGDEGCAGGPPLDRRPPGEGNSPERRALRLGFRRDDLCRPDPVYHRGDLHDGDHAAFGGGHDPVAPFAHCPFLPAVDERSLGGSRWRKDISFGFRRLYCCSP
jgi:predicted RND superfamily exporter protein